MPFDKKELRNALGQFPTGVCVVTAQLSEQSSPFGMTINSFSSVSLEPPLVLWSVQNEGAQSADWLASTHFAISVLSDGQQEVSNFFATPGERHVPEKWLIRGSLGQALIANALASFECRVIQQVVAGDHTILIGQIESLATASAPADPLLFFSGQYREIKRSRYEVL